MRARSTVSPVACHSRPVFACSHRFARVTPGPGRTNFFQPVRWTSSQTTHTRATAASFGQSTAQARRARSPALVRPGAGPRSRASSPASVVSAAMAAYLLAQPAGDLGGQLGDRGGIHPPRALDGDRVLLDDPARTAGQQDNAVAEADGLADVVRDEQDGQRPADPLAYPVELVVQQV